MTATLSPAEADEAVPPVSIFPVLLVNFIGALGFSLVIPFLVFLVHRWGGNAVVYGIVAATYPACQFVGAPILGRWSDRFGRRKVLLLSQAGTLLSWLIFAVAFFVPETPLWKTESEGLATAAVTLPLLVVLFARALDGLTGGNISVANAYLADITPDHDRGKNFGRMAVSSNLGFIIGPMLAGLLGATALGELLPVLAAAGVSLVATWIIAFHLPESDPCLYRENPSSLGIRKVMGQEQQDCEEAKRLASAHWIEILRQQHVMPMLLLYLLIFLGFNLFYTAFPNHAATALQWTVTQTGLFFTVLSAAMVLVQGPVLARLAANYREPSLVLVGGAILTVGFVVLAARGTPLVYTAALLIALGNGLMWPSYMALLSKTGDPRHQGMVQGLAASVGSLASIVGLIFGGFAYTFLGGGTFLLSAAVLLLCFPLALWLRTAFPAKADSSE